MVAKKKVVKKVSGRKVSKKIVRKPVANHTLSRSVRSRNINVSKSKFGLVLKNLFFFGLLFVASLILYYFFVEPFWANLFYLASIAFGSIFALFLLVLLIVLFLRVIRN